MACKESQFESDAISSPPFLAPVERTNLLIAGFHQLERVSDHDFCVLPLIITSPFQGGGPISFQFELHH